MNFPLKTIQYRGGVVTFEIPSHWKEEYDAEGGGTFYEDRPDSGTLRLHVLGFGGKEPAHDTINKLVAKETTELLECGFHLRQYTTEAEEEGTPLRLYRWEIYVPVPPVNFRLACFTYTIVAGQENDRRIEHELELVNHLVHSARFSTERGVTGEYFENPEKN